MIVELKTEGLHLLDARLRGLPVLVANRIADEALDAGALIVKAAILARAPRLSGALADAIAIGKGMHKKAWGSRVMSVGFFGAKAKALASTTKMQVGLRKKGVATGKTGGLQYFYPTSVEYGHDKPYASMARYKRGEKRLRSSRSKSLTFSSADAAGMSQAMAAYRMRQSARGGAMNRKLAASKAVPPHPFIVPGSQAAAPGAFAAIEQTLTRQMEAAWSMGKTA